MAAANGQPNSGKLRFNVAFFDGHVETMDAHTAMNPKYWVPRGAVVPQSEPCPEALSAYMANSPSYVSP